MWGGYELKIAIDLDDTVFDFWAGVCQSLNLEYGLELDPNETKNWDDNALKQLAIFGDGPDGTPRTWWDWLQERDWIWATFKPVPGAIGAIKTLRQQGHFVEALTSKPEWAEWTVWRLLGRWRPPFNQVTIVPTGESKGEWSNAYLLIDDRDLNIQEWLTSLTNGELRTRTAIAFQRPWTHMEDIVAERGTLAVARHWGEVLALVEELDKLDRFGTITQEEVGYR